MSHISKFINMESSSSIVEGVDGFLRGVFAEGVTKGTIFLSSGSIDSLIKYSLMGMTELEPPSDYNLTELPESILKGYVHPVTGELMQIVGDETLKPFEMRFEYQKS